MKKTPSALVCPELTTTDDYVKLREKSRNDFEHFVEKRNAARAAYMTSREEKKRM